MVSDFCTVLQDRLQWRKRKEQKEHRSRIVLLDDINEFRTDTFGSQIGDRVSRYFAMLRNAKSRRSDEQVSLLTKASLVAQCRNTMIQPEEPENRHTVHRIRTPLRFPRFYVKSFLHFATFISRTHVEENTKRSFTKSETGNLTVENFIPHSCIRLTNNYY